jgi:hypothetical protein
MVVHGWGRVMFCNICFSSGIADTLINQSKMVVPSSISLFVFTISQQTMFKILDRRKSSHYALLFGDIHLLRESELYIYKDFCDDRKCYRPN